jgi:UDP-3-O-[3-hydroxymyristoyl] glucosamine N-acyltransferase
LVYTLKDIAEFVGGKVFGSDQTLISGINSLADAKEGEISFYADPRYEKELRDTRASAIFVARVTEAYRGPQVLVPHPALAHARVAQLFSSPHPRFPGISEKAAVHENSIIGSNPSIFPLVYVGEKARIGDEVVLYPGVFVGDRVRIGNKTIVFPNVTIMPDCILGNEVIIHAGTVIGSDGFGFVRDGSRSVKVPQIGIVQIDDQVEIGANNCIDRAAMGKTWIKRGVKTDNLVHIAHNVVIGEDTVIAAQTAIGGSVHIGKEVVIGGQVAISDHIRIEDRSMIGSQSGVAKSLGPGEIVSGSPAMPHRLWLRTSGIIPRLPDFRERLRKLEKKVEKLAKPSKPEKEE